MKFLVLFSILALGCARSVKRAHLQEDLIGQMPRDTEDKSVAVVHEQVRSQAAQIKKAAAKMHTRLQSSHLKHVMGVVDSDANTEAKVGADIFATEDIIEQVDISTTSAEFKAGDDLLATEEISGQADISTTSTEDPAKLTDKLTEDSAKDQKGESVVEQFSQLIAMNFEANLDDNNPDERGYGIHSRAIGLGIVCGIGVVVGLLFSRYK